MNVVPMPLLVRDSMDFSAYMAESEPRVKVISADAWGAALADSTESEAQITGAKLPWKSTQDNLRFRPGEITVWAGANSTGKSQILGFAALGFLAQNERCCIASFEMSPLSTLKRMLRQGAQNGTPSRPFATRFAGWLKGRLWLYDHMGSVRADVLYAVIRYCAIELKIQHFIIDNLMKCVRGEEDKDGQKDFIDTLTNLARDHSLHIHLVHHIRKGENEDRPPNKFDIKGSGAITDLADQVMIVWRNRIKERAVKKLEMTHQPIDAETDAKPDVLVCCEKNRHGEWEGRIPLWYHAPTLQYMADSRRKAINVVGELL